MSTGSLSRSLVWHVDGCLVLIDSLCIYHQCKQLYVVSHTHLNLMHYNTRLEIHYHVQLKWRRGGSLSVIQVVK